MNRTHWLVAAAALGLLGECGGGGGGDSASSGNSVNNGAPVTSSVSGTVVDQSGAPVAGVTVNVFHHNDHTRRAGAAA